MPAGLVWLFMNDGGGMLQYGLRTDLLLVGAGALRRYRC